MAESIETLILQNVPADGSTIGNGRLLDTLRALSPTLTEQDYWTARDALIDRGVLGKGRGRGGAVYLIGVDPSAANAPPARAPTRTGSPAKQQANLWSFADIAAATDGEDGADYQAATVEPDPTVDEPEEALDQNAEQANGKAGHSSGKRTSAIKKSDLYSSLWASCDELRGGMDASQYKDYVLVLLFIKYVSDKYADIPYAPIDIPPGASFKDMVALKGKSDIGDQINELT